MAQRLLYNLRLIIDHLSHLETWADISIGLRWNILNVFNKARSLSSAERWNWLCVVNFLVVFQTGSMGLNSGEYLGKRNNSNLHLFWFSHFFPSSCRLCHGALSIIRNTLFGEQRLTICVKNLRNEYPLNLSANKYVNLASDNEIAP